MDACKDWTQLKVTVPLEQLDALVAALGAVKTAEDIVITESILVGETAIQYNLSM